MSTQSRWTRLLAFAVVLPIVACAPGDEADAGLEDDVGMEPAAVPDEGMGMAPVTIMLAAVNGSGVTGTATATHMGDSVTVIVSVSDASEEGAFPAHIHSGMCPDPGGVTVPLTALQVSGGGGTSTTSIAAAQLAEDQDAVVQVHAPGGQPVACGDLTGHGAMDMDMDMGDTTGT